MREQGSTLAAALNNELGRYIQERWRVPSRLELKFEKLYLKLFLPRARHSTRGASKRYAGLLHGTDIDGVQFVGMEVVRRDWTALAKQVQRELYHRLFTDQPVDVYLADVVKRVRNGELDDALVYRKNLRKETGEYTATTPPHVVAARKSTQPLGRLISYVITAAGPEPLDNVQHTLDREHYVVKQVGAAVADAFRASPWRVALIASSSWSHAFLSPKNGYLWSDMESDRLLFDALVRGDYAVWREQSLAQMMAAGQHEMLNWMLLAGAMEALGHRPIVHDYVESFLFTSQKVFMSFESPAAA